MEIEQNIKILQWNMGSYYSNLDEMKININEQQVVLV